MLLGRFNHTKSKVSVPLTPSLSNSLDEIKGCRPFDYLDTGPDKLNVESEGVKTTEGSVGVCGLYVTTLIPVLPKSVAKTGPSPLTSDVLSVTPGHRE